ncbi:MAG: diguanylate cyclase [Sphaerobacter sp.]|nr:diguanylate cyclase [Sphaerobacter sp.]
MDRAEACRVLVVSHRPDTRARLLALLTGLRIPAAAVDGVDRATADVAAHPTDIVVFDAGLVPNDAIAWMEDLRPALAEPTIIAVVADAAAPSDATLLAAGADVVLREPLAEADLRRLMQLRRALVAESGRRWRRRLRRSNAMRQLALDMVELAESEDRWPAALEVGRRLLRARGLAVWTLVEHEDRLQALAVAGLTPAFVAEVEARSAGRARAAVEAAVRQHHVPLCFADAVPDPRRITSPESAAAAAGMTLATMLPIRHASAVFGLLSAYFGEASDYDPMDIPLFETLAGALGAALYTRRLRRELTITGQLYRELVEGLPIGMLLCDSVGRIRLVNGALSDLTGRPRDDLIGAPLADLFVNPHAIPWADWRADGAAPSAPVVLCMRGRQGQRLIVACRARRLAVPGEAGAPSEGYLQITVEDITSQHRRLHELQLLHDLSQLIARGGDTDVAFQLVAERLIGAMGYRHVVVAMITPDGEELERRAEEGVTPCGVARWSIDRGITGRALRENRSILVADVRQEPDYLEVDPEVHSELVAVIRSAGRPVGVLNIETDASHPLTEEDVAIAEWIAVHLGLLLDQIEFTERLEQQARTDPATGIANRRVLVERLQSLANDRRLTSAALFLLDIDKFKQVNDCYGHVVGDEILVQVVRRLAASLRPHDLLARYAGDELAVVLRNVDPSSALEVAERLRRAIAEAPFVHGGISLRLTVSIGVAMFPLQGATPDELLAVADRAMYGAKLRGGDAVHSEFVVP